MNRATEERERERKRERREAADRHQHYHASILFFFFRSQAGPPERACCYGNSPESPLSLSPSLSLSLHLSLSFSLSLSLQHLNKIQAIYRESPATHEQNTHRTRVWRERARQNKTCRLHTCCAPTRAHIWACTHTHTHTHTPSPHVAGACCCVSICEWSPLVVCLVCLLGLLCVLCIVFKERDGRRDVKCVCVCVCEALQWNLPAAVVWYISGLSCQLMQSALRADW